MILSDVDKVRLARVEGGGGRDRIDSSIITTSQSKSPFNGQAQPSTSTAKVKSSPLGRPAVATSTLFKHTAAPLSISANPTEIRTTHDEAQVLECRGCLPTTGHAYTMSSVLHNTPLQQEKRQTDLRASNSSRKGSGYNASSAARIGAKSPSAANFYGVATNSPTFKVGPSLFTNQHHAPSHGPLATSPTGEKSSSFWPGVVALRVGSSSSLAYPPSSVALAPLQTRPKRNLLTDVSNSSAPLPTTADPEVEQRGQPTNVTSTLISPQPGDDVSRTWSRDSGGFDDRRLKPQATKMASTKQKPPITIAAPCANIRHIKRRKGEPVSLEVCSSSLGSPPPHKSDGGHSPYGEHDEEVSFMQEGQRGPLSNAALTSTTPTLDKLISPQRSKLKSPPPTPQLLMSLRRHSLRQELSSGAEGRAVSRSKRGLLRLKYVDSNNREGEGVEFGEVALTRDGGGGSSSSGALVVRSDSPFSFLDENRLVAVALGGVGGTGEVVGAPRRFLDPFLKDADMFLRSELKLVDSSDGGAVVGVYREVFEGLEHQFARDSGCGGLLRRIRGAYEYRIAELEKLAQIALTGDPALQREKERYLSSTEEALSTIERSVAHEKVLRARIVEAEQHGHQVELNIASELTDLRETRMELSERAILDTAALRDLVETNQSYSKVNQDLRERLERADQVSTQRQEAANQRIEELEVRLSEEKAAHRETVLRHEAMERHRADEMRRVRESSISPEQHAALQLHAKKLEESLRTLKRKMGWLEADLSKALSSSMHGEGGGGTNSSVSGGAAGDTFPSAAVDDMTNQD